MNAAAPTPGRGAAAFPWDEAMAFAMGRLGLSPKAFWAMAPREFAAAMAPMAGALPTPPSRSGLDELMARFPDETR